MPRVAPARRRGAPRATPGAARRPSRVRMAAAEPAPVEAPPLTAPASETESEAAPEIAPEVGDAATRLAQFTREVAESLKLHRSATVRLSAAFLMAAAAACTPPPPPPAGSLPA